MTHTASLAHGVSALQQRERWFAFLLISAVIFLFIFFPGVAHAQQGPSLGIWLWRMVLDGIYGPWGLVAGLVVMAIGLGAMLKWGFGIGIGIIALGFVVFFLPGLATQAQNLGKAFAGVGG